MTRQRNPLPAPIQPRPHHRGTPPTHEPPPPEHFRESQFINRGDSGPDDPSRHGEANVPQQFLDWFLDSLPEHPGSVDFEDVFQDGRNVRRGDLSAGARGFPSDTNDPRFDTTILTGVDLAQGSSPAARSYVTVDIPAEEATSTATLHAKPPVSRLTRWVLITRSSKRLKLVLAAVVLLLVAWFYLEPKVPAPDSPVQASASQAALVTLLDAPVATVLAGPSTKPVATAPIASDDRDDRLGPKPLSAATKVTNSPQTGNLVEHASAKSTNQTESIPEVSSGPIAPTGTVNGPPALENSAHSSGLTPIFEPR